MSREGNNPSGNRRRSHVLKPMALTDLTRTLLISYSSCSCSSSNLLLSYLFDLSRRNSFILPSTSPTTCTCCKIANTHNRLFLPLYLQRYRGDRGNLRVFQRALEKDCGRRNLFQPTCPGTKSLNPLSLYIHIYSVTIKSPLRTFGELVQDMKF